MSTEIKKTEAASVAPSERFTASVMREFENLSGEPIQITNLQRKLIKNYFIKIDATLKEAETKRMAKKEEYRGVIPYNWSAINMNKLATDVIAFSSVGLDPLQKNNVFPIPYLNSKTNQIDVNFTRGYNGIKLVAMKYGFDVPDNVVVELVFSNDKFKMIKKDKNNPFDSYEFAPAEDAFNRGDVVGGFWFHEFIERPEKNKLKEYSLAQILKRRPDNASAEFWGGEKDVWKDGKKTGKKEEVEGWFEEMCHKTIVRAAHDAIAIDSEKIDEHIVQIMANEAEGLPEIESNQDKIAAVVADKGNKETFKFEDANVVTDTPPATDTEKVDTLAKVGQELAVDDPDVVQPTFGNMFGDPK